MKQIVTTLLLSLVVLKQSLIQCSTGFSPSPRYEATLDTSTKKMTFDNVSTGIKSEGIAVYTEDDDHLYYHLPQSFSDAVQMFFDGGDWWLCQAQNECLRCGQILNKLD